MVYQSVLLSSAGYSPRRVFKHYTTTFYLIAHHLHEDYKLVVIDGSRAIEYIVGNIGFLRELKIKLDCLANCSYMLLCVGQAFLEEGM